MQQSRLYQMAIDGKTHEILRNMHGRGYTNTQMLRSIACEDQCDFAAAAKELILALDDSPAMTQIFENMTPFSAARVVARITVQMVLTMPSICQEGFHDECNSSESLRAQYLMLSNQPLQVTLDTLLKQGLKVHAIKLYRQHQADAGNEIGLREAKDFIDARWAVLEQELVSSR